MPLHHSTEGLLTFFFCPQFISRDLYIIHVCSYGMGAKISLPFFHLSHPIFFFFFISSEYPHARNGTDGNGPIAFFFPEKDPPESLQTGPRI